METKYFIHAREHKQGKFIKSIAIGNNSRVLFTEYSKEAMRVTHKEYDFIKPLLVELFDLRYTALCELNPSEY